MDRSTGRLQGYVAMLVVLLVGLSACGTGNVSTSGASPTSQVDPADGGSPTEPPELSLATVRVAGPGTTNELIVRIAEEQGFFEEQGLAVERVTLGSGSDILAAMTGGSVEIGLMGSANIPIARTRGVPLRGFAVLTTGIDEILAISAEAADAAGVNQDSPIADKIQAVKGLKVGIPEPGSISTVLAEQVMQQEGIDPQQDVEMIALGGSEGLVNGFVQGQVDAIFHLPPTPLVAVSRRDGIVGLFSEVEAMQDANWASFAALEDMLNDHPDTVLAFTKALLQSRDFILNNRDEASEIGSALFPETDEQVWELSFDITVTGYEGGIAFTQEGWQSGALDVANSITGEEFDVPLEEGATNEYVEEAAAELGLDVMPSP